MKHFNKLFVFVLLAGTCFTAAAQQPLKFGHINRQELIMLMPESDSARVKLENYGKELEEQIETMQVEFNNKYNAFQTKGPTWSDAIKEQKSKELQEMSQRIQEFQQTASADFQKMNQTLTNPVIEKAVNAIKKVGKDNGFIYIFDTSMGVIPYINDGQSTDVLLMVKKELNIPAEKKVPSASAGTATKR